MQVYDSITDLPDYYITTMAGLCCMIGFRILITTF